MEEEKICLKCEKKFITTNKFKIFCSVTCQQNYWNNKKKQKLVKNYHFKCLVCNHLWNMRKDNHLFYPPYCPSCLSHSWDFGNNIKCKCCNRTCFIPQIHHIDGNNQNNYYDNRIPLCDDCHVAIHYGIGIQNDNKKRGSGGKSKRRMYGFYAPNMINQKSNIKYEIIDNIKSYQLLLKRNYNKI